MIDGRYELISELGQGGMGTVYKAYDRTLDEKVALKVLSETAGDSAEADRRFRAEIKLARRIRHANVCGIHEYGESDGIKYIVMELVVGEDLKQYLRARGKLSTHDAVGLVRQISDGLQSIHDAGVIHRDLKLANVMRDSTGRLRLMDFGLAKGMGDAKATATGMILGTAAYMSPEQVMAGTVDSRTDLYSLGIMTFELLTGRVPFREADPMVLLSRQLHEAPPLDDPDIPAALVPVLAKALAKAPEERHASAVDFASELTRASGASLGAAGPGMELGAGEATTALPAAASRSISRPAPSTTSTEARGRVAPPAPRFEPTLAFVQRSGVSRPPEALSRGTTGAPQAPRSPGADGPRSGVTSAARASKAPAARHRWGLGMGIAAGAIMAVGLGVWLAFRAVEMASSMTTSDRPSVTTSPIATNAQHDQPIATMPVNPEPSMPPPSTPPPQTAAPTPRPQSSATRLLDPSRARGGVDFSGNWVGKATEKTPEGVVTFDVDALLRSNDPTFGGRMKVDSPAGPLDVLINGEGVEVTVTAVNGKPTLCVTVDQFNLTTLATGARQSQTGNTYYFQFAGERLLGWDKSGAVTIELKRRSPNR
ncbi:MAG: protein kinase [Vicinamibacteria bacterium]|nr:protein kinase [Vicinamibacteria bacterium]